MTAARPSLAGSLVPRTGPPRSCPPPRGRPPESPARPAFRLLACVVVAGLAGLFVPRDTRAAEGATPARFSEDVQPVLEEYCYGCHGLGVKKGGVGLDAFADEDAA